MSIFDDACTGKRGLAWNVGCTTLGTVTPNYAA